MVYLKMYSGLLKFHACFYVVTKDSYLLISEINQMLLKDYLQCTSHVPQHKLIFNSNWNSAMCVFLLLFSFCLFVCYN